MTRLTTSFVLGYHGCAEEVGLKALLGNLSLIKSAKEYDWLGPGIYFWESDPRRAQEWAEQRGYKKPFVIGAVIDLRNCLNLLERENLDLLADAHKSFVKIQKKSGLEMPKNRDTKRGPKRDKLLRYLDCAVIKNLHSMIAEDPEGEAFDTVRGLFVEGGRAYSGSGFNLLTHTQIAVCKEDCIRGIFLPR